MKLLIDIDEEKYEWIKNNNPNIDINSIVGAIANGTPYEEIPTGAWTPIKYRPLTEEERVEFSEYWGVEYCDTVSEVAFDCPMPEDQQEILISTEYGVYLDVCSYDPDEGYALEDRGDWEGVLAWMPRPAPYGRSET